MRSTTVAGSRLANSSGSRADLSVEGQHERLRKTLEVADVHTFRRAATQPPGQRLVDMAEQGVLRPVRVDGLEQARPEHLHPGGATSYRSDGSRGGMCEHSTSTAPSAVTAF